MQVFGRRDHPGLSDPEIAPLEVARSCAVSAEWTCCVVRCRKRPMSSKPEPRWFLDGNDANPRVMTGRPLVLQVINIFQVLLDIHMLPDSSGPGRLEQPGDPDRSRCWYTLSLKQTPLSLRLACHSVPEPAASAANWVHLIPWDPWMMVSDVLVDRLIQVM